MHSFLNCQGDEKGRKKQIANLKPGLPGKNRRLVPPKILQFNELRRRRYKGFLVHHVRHLARVATVVSFQDVD